MSSEASLPAAANSNTDTDDVRPFVWTDSHPPPQETLQLWRDVGNGIDKNQTGESQFAVSRIFQSGLFCAFCASVFRSTPCL
jgi:hypothetical protein